MDKILKENRVIICAGTGGVGKTTVSAALGIRSAQLGFRTLILTIDPAKRLKTALGLSENSETTRVDLKDSGELYASMIDFKSVFDEFVERMSSDEKSKERVLNNSLYKQLSTNLGGTQEYTSLERLYSAVHDEKFERVILDTPPTQHAVEFLSAPQRFYSLFDSSIVKWFLPKSEADSFFQKILHRGTRIALKQMENLTGTEFIQELSQFFESIHSFRDKVQERSGEIHSLLTSEDTAFVLVTGFDAIKLKETGEFKEELRRGGYRLCGLIVNRVFPDLLENGVDREPLDGDRLKLYEFYCSLRERERNRISILEGFLDNLDREVEVIKIPDLDLGESAVAGLSEIARRLVND